MSLMHNPVPVDSRIADLERRLFEKTQECERLSNILNQQGPGIHELRRVLSPLYGALQRIFGELDQLPQDNAIQVDSRKAAIWDNWKRKMPGLPAKFIDALLLNGALTQTQLRIHAQCAAGSVAGVVSQLHKAGLINKSDGKISLKDL